MGVDSPNARTDLDGRAGLRTRRVTQGNPLKDSRNSLRREGTPALPFVQSRAFFTRAVLRKAISFTVGEISLRRVRSPSLT
jgi:hypothetical protein